MMSSIWVYVFLFLGPVVLTLIYQAWISPSPSIGKRGKITIIKTTAVVVSFVLLCIGIVMVIQMAQGFLDALKTPHPF